MLLKRFLPKPRLSIVVVGYRMPEQLLNTVYSLSPTYQHRVEAIDYEVILVENRSARMANKSQLRAQLPGLRYYARAERDPTPVNAINFGLSKARADHVAVMIDGARLVSPGIITHTLQAFSISPQAVVATPGYHLGDKVQQESSLSGYDETYEKNLLDKAGWREDGYQLFTVSCLSQSCIKGAFAPLPETNWLAMSKQNFERIGGFHPGFNQHGGGYANHDAWSQACALSDSVPIVLAGEGCFHQYHGGATTDAKGKDLPGILEDISKQYRDIRGKDYSAPGNTALILGKAPPQALAVLAESASLASTH